MNKKNSIRHKIVTSKYFELSGLLLLIILYSCIVQTKSGNFLTIGNLLQRLQRKRLKKEDGNVYSWIQAEIGQRCTRILMIL